MIYLKMDWHNHFQTFVASEQTFEQFLLALQQMELFAPWARMYWARLIWKRRRESPLALLYKSPFISFFFGRQRDELYLLNIWGSVHMACFLLSHRFSDAKHFMELNQFSLATFFFRGIEPWTPSQGDWKCATCGTVDGRVHICPMCQAPIKDWIKLLHHGTSTTTDPTTETK